jgi:hypothetical protein
VVDVPRALDPSDAERLDVLRRAMTAGNVDGESRAVGPIFRRDQLEAGVTGGGGDDIDSTDSMIDRFTITDDGTATFTLTFDPVEDSWNVTLSGVGQVDTDDYTIDGQTLTVLDPAGLFLGVDLQGPWVLQVQYDYLTGVPVAPTDSDSDIVLVSSRTFDGITNALVCDISGFASDGDLMILGVTHGAIPTTPAGWTQRGVSSYTKTLTVLTRDGKRHVSDARVPDNPVGLCGRGAPSWRCVLGRGQRFGGVDRRDLHFPVCDDALRWVGSSCGGPRLDSLWERGV